MTEKTIHVGDIPIPPCDDPRDYCGGLTPLPQTKWRSIPITDIDIPSVEGLISEVVVPIEPTQAMLTAAYGIAGECNGSDRLAREIWQAMIAARP